MQRAVHDPLFPNPQPMAQSAARTVDEYLEALPDDDRAVVSAVRKFVRANLPKGYEEAMASGMIGYGIPLSRYPKTYNKQPLSYVALAAQKNHYALYLMCAYMDPAQMKALEDGFRKAGKKLDMGKSCLRFKSLDDLPLDVIGSVVASTPVERYIEIYEGTRK